MTVRVCVCVFAIYVDGLLQRACTFLVQVKKLRDGPGTRLTRALVQLQFQRQPQVVLLSKVTAKTVVYSALFSQEHVL